MSEVDTTIDARFSEYTEELQTWIRQPSIAATNTGISEMASLLSHRLERAGAVVRVFENQGGSPVVYAEFRGSIDRTLLFYNHYDVQPPGALSDWRFDPFSGAIEEGRLWGRGTADNKGSLLSRIYAVEALLETGGSLPINVKFIAEGEEEIGSPNLDQFVNSHQELLRADACIWEEASKDAQGRPQAKLGNKGMCYVGLTAKGTKTDLHSMYASVLPNAAWRLVWALSSLKDGRENILIDGFYDDVEPLSTEEIAVLERTPLDVDGLASEAGVPELLAGTRAIEAARRLYGLPTCTICGLLSGHAGEGARTILPSRAMAKVDFRLVVNQDPRDVLEKLRSHLDRLGFGDVEVTPLSMREPIKTPVTDPFVQLVIDAAARVYDRPMVVQPTSPGSGPRSAFARWTTMPIIAVGVSHIGSRTHGIDENVILEDCRQGIKHIAAIIQLCGERGWQR